VVYLRFSGAGRLAPVIVFASLILGVWLGGMAFGGGPGPAAGLVVAARLLPPALLDGDGALATRWRSRSRRNVPYAARPFVDAAWCGSGARVPADAAR
jgi:hypothetical protein